MSCTIAPVVRHDYLSSLTSIDSNNIERNSSQCLNFDESTYSHCLSPSDLSYSSIISSLSSPSISSEINRSGFVIIDHAFGPALSHSFLEEILWLRNNQFMTSNCTAFVSREEQSHSERIKRLFVKPNIFESELLPAIRNRLPRLNHLYDVGIPLLEAVLQRQFPALQLYHGHTSIKCQVNDGSGGAFNLHYDSPGGNKDSRRLTLLLYLNPSYNHLLDGGCLRLQPFLQPTLDVPPIFDRVVLFRSDRVLHAVTPSMKRRVCFTIWFHGSGDDEVNVDSECAPSSSALFSSFASSFNGEESNEQNGWLSLIRRPSFQRIFAKYFYTQCWRRSIIRAHSPSSSDIISDEFGALSLLQSLENDVRRLEEWLEYQPTGIQQIFKEMRNKVDIKEEEEENKIINIDENIIHKMKQIEYRKKQVLEAVQKKYEQQLENNNNIVEEEKTDSFSALDFL